MKRVFSISLLIIFISGQINLTWASHFCGDIRVASKAMLGQGHIDCGMDMMDQCDSQEPSSIPILNATSCCSNNYISVEVGEDFQRAEFSYNPQTLFTTSFCTSFFDITPAANTLKANGSYIPPPKLQVDLQVLYQAFLL